MFLLGSYVQRHAPWVPPTGNGHGGFTESIDMSLPWLRSRNPPIDGRISARNLSALTASQRPIKGLDIRRRIACAD